MIISGIPAKMGIVWASGAGGSYVRTPPVASQIGTTNGAASFTDGFPPLNFDPVASGGIPPFGEDMNGILRIITTWLQWIQAGGPIPYDSTFQAAIGGYPSGAVVRSVSFPGAYWQSTVDNNTGSPDSGAAGWTPATFRDAGGVGGTNNLGGVVVTGTSASGASIQLNGNGTTPRKWVGSANGFLFVTNNAHSADILLLDDSGNLTVPGTVSTSGVSAGANGVSAGIAGIATTGPITSNSNIIAEGAVTAGTGVVSNSGNVQASLGKLRANIGAYLSGDPNCAVLLNDFTTSETNPGYTILPSGLIIQWGLQILNGNGAVLEPFPIAFPNACINVVCCEGAASASNTWNTGFPTLHASGGFTKTGWFHWGMGWTETGPGWQLENLTTAWFAIGY